MSSGRRNEIVRLATRALKALRASSISLRPRCARLTALTARAATRPWCNYRRPILKCLTTFTSGATVESASLAATRGPSTSTGVEHVRIGGLRPRFGPHFSNHFPCLFVRCHVRETDNRIGLRFGTRPGADPTVHHTSNHHAATAVRLSEVDASGDALSAPIHCEQQRHRRSEWAGVSWPKDDDHERDAAGGIGLDLA